MYYRMLKKDLMRKKAINIILLIFIILVTTFASSSANNIISVTTAMDDFLEISNTPDYLVTLNDINYSPQLDSTLNTSDAIDSYRVERMLLLKPANFKFEDACVDITKHENIIHSDTAINYFLHDDNILKEVKPGEVYISESKAKSIGVTIGDSIEIELGGAHLDLTVAGTIKDAVMGSNQVNIIRYIVNEEDFEKLNSMENAREKYGVSTIYVYSSDADTAITEIESSIESKLISMDKAFIKFTYIFDMIITGIMLVVCVLLIAIALVVLRFTIGFTLTEEFREIGIMKAIGISGLNIRKLYLIKYVAISVIGAAIGLALSFPFGKLVMKISSPAIIIGEASHIVINVITATLVILTVMLFCYGCTRKVKRMTPVDTVKNGQSGERFRKKRKISLAKSKLPSTTHLALNDVASSPKRFAIISLTFVLCLSIMLTLSTTVFTMKSGSLRALFGVAECDLYLDESQLDFASEDGNKRFGDHLEEMEKTLIENGMPSNCFAEAFFTLPVVHGDTELKISVCKGIKTTMDMYEYTEGEAPKNKGEVAITRITADDLGVDIGDTITIRTVDGSKDYTISATFQSMYELGEGIRLHSDEWINFAQLNYTNYTQIAFSDSPTTAEIERRMNEIITLYPTSISIRTEADTVSGWLGVTEILDALKTFITILTILLTALITVLMERSFIAREEGEIAFMKAIGISSSKISAIHGLRFLFVGIITVIIGLSLSLPITHLCMDPIFKMTGAEIAVDYMINPLEMFAIFPVILIATTTVCAFLTSLEARKIKPSDTANIE